MKMRSKESDDLLLFENNSYTMVRDSSNTDTTKTSTTTTKIYDIGSQRANDDNDERRRQQWQRWLRSMQHLMDNDKHRRETVDAHYKTRAINTNHIEK